MNSLSAHLTPVNSYQNIGSPLGTWILMKNFLRDGMIYWLTDLSRTLHPILKHILQFLNVILEHDNKENSVSALAVGTGIV